MSRVNALAMEKQIADEEQLERTRERLGRLTEIYSHLIELQKDRYNFDKNTTLLLQTMRKQIDNLCKVDEQTVDLIEMELGERG